MHCNLPTDKFCLGSACLQSGLYFECHAMHLTANMWWDSVWGEGRGGRFQHICSCSFSAVAQTYFEVFYYAHYKEAQVGHSQFAEIHVTLANRLRW